MLIIASGSDTKMHFFIIRHSRLHLETKIQLMEGLPYFC